MARRFLNRTRRWKSARVPTTKYRAWNTIVTRPRPRNDTTRGHASTANFFREIENEWPPRHNENLFRALPFFCARVKNRRPVFSIIFSPGKTFERFSMPKAGTKGEIPSLASLSSPKDEKVFVKRRRKKFGCSDTTFISQRVRHPRILVNLCTLNLYMSRRTRGRKIPEEPVSLTN